MIAFYIEKMPQDMSKIPVSPIGIDYRIV